MDLQADAVAQAVAETVAQAGVRDQLTGHGVHVLRDAGEVTLVLEGRGWDGHYDMMSSR